jgi:uncharacterized protein with PIN domain
MLGSLARWLRILGYDTAYDRTIDDATLVERCRLERRIALTKDRRLVKRKALCDYLFIRGIHLGDQLREVLARTGDRVEDLPLFSRCLECNRALVEATPEEIRDRVPEYTYNTQTRFSACPHCGRVYWPGTHRSRILGRLGQLLGSRKVAKDDEVP